MPGTVSAEPPWVSHGEAAPTLCIMGDWPASAKPLGSRMCRDAAPALGPQRQLASVRRSHRQQVSHGEGDAGLHPKAALIQRLEVFNLGSMIIIRFPINYS